MIEFTSHPILKSPSDEEILLLARKDPKLLEELHRAHEGRIEAAINDPVRYGFDLPGWDRIREGLRNYNEVLTLGGNRSGKTTGCAKIVMQAAIENDDGYIVCFSQNEDTSIKVQQAAIWEMMPKEFKKKTKGTEGYINFSMQNGFTGKSFIFPDTRTRVDFKTYTQFSNNQTILEGFQYGFKGNPDLNIGAWLDEYLGDAALVNTLRFRLATLNSKLLIGFTPIDGFTPFISEYCTNAETTETRSAALLNDRQLPIKQYSPNRDASIVYLHSDENPFGGYKRLSKDLKDRPEEEILVRAYGVPVKSMTSLLPLFSTEVNVLSEVPNKYGMTFPCINDDDYTIYMVLDPAGARNSVAIWAAVNEKGEIYIFDEFPDRDTYGEWATFGDPKWKRGPASKKIGYDVQGYADLFKSIEESHGVEVFERIGDSRYFARENESNDDLFTLFDDCGLNFVPSDGRNEDMGISALDEWFSYNPNAKVDEMNKPRCFIHERCGNLIDSLLNYKSNGKADEPLKDFFDTIRYLRMANRGEGPDHFTDRDMKVTQKSTGGY